MRIAYIAPYQGADLVKNRPSTHNASLAARVKISIIAELLKRNSHDVEIISQGEVDQYECKYYPALRETELFHPDIPIFYASSVPMRFVNGFWSSWRLLNLFKERHSLRPFDLLIIYNMKRGHLTCADYAMKTLRIPVVLEYEDDLFVDVQGNALKGFRSRFHLRTYRRMMDRVSGCTAVSPYLLTQFPPATPKLLLRGVVSEHIENLGKQGETGKQNRVVFSGTHESTQGLEQLIRAWRKLALPGWELHIAGRGSITSILQELARGDQSIVFHGFLSREENARLLWSAKIGMNPQDVTKTPGNVFALKIIEYLAARLHVITTPRGFLEPDLENGVSYIQDNTSHAIATALHHVITTGKLEQTAQQAAVQRYGTGRYLSGAKPTGGGSGRAGNRAVTAKGTEGCIRMIQLIITIKTQPGRAGDYIQAFREIAPEVRREEGCIEYGLYQDSTDSRFDNPVRSDTVVICEKWTSIEALQQHNRLSVPLAKFRQIVKEIKLESHYWLLTPVSHD